jgi:hypothetical protein
MKTLILALALLLGAAMLLPSVSAVPALVNVDPSASVGPSVEQAPDASVVPSAEAAASASLEPSGSPLPDALVQMDIGSETEPIRDWTIAVSGGVPSVDVLSVPDPTFGWVEFSVTMSEGSATVELTATLPAGSRLTEGTCVSDDDEEAHDVLVAPGQLVLEVVPGVTYQCFYASASDTPRGSAEIVAHLFLDGDGDRATVDDQDPIEGWEIGLELTGGKVIEDSSVSNSDGLAGWLISYDGDRTSVTLSEVIQGDLLLLDARCTKVTDSGDETVGEFDGYRMTFEIEHGDFASYQCSFMYVPSDFVLAEISVWHRIDADGDLTTFRDRDRAVSWQFEASFEDDVGILFADAETDDHLPASWVISFRSDSTRVVLTAVPQAGSRVIHAACLDDETEEGVEVPSTLAGNSLLFGVNGLTPIPGLWPWPYSCTFVSTSSGGAPAPTVPPTDGASAAAPTEPARWRLQEFAFAALIASLLVLRLRPMPPRESRAGAGSRHVDAASG